MNLFFIALVALWPWKQKEDTAIPLYCDQTSKFEYGILVKTYRCIFCRNSGMIDFSLGDFWTPVYGNSRSCGKSSLADLTISLDTKKYKTRVSASTREEGELLLILRNDHYLSRYDTDWFGDTLFLIKVWIVVADSARAWEMAWRWRYDTYGYTLRQAERGNSLSWRGSSIGYTPVKTAETAEAVEEKEKD